MLLPLESLPSLPASYFSSFLLLLHSWFRFSCIFFASHAQWNVSVDVSKYLSASTFSFHLFFVFSFLFHNHRLFSHAQWNVTVNMLESLCLPPHLTFVLSCSLIFAHCLLFMTARCHPFTSTFDHHKTTAHNRCDEFFVNDLFW